MRQFVESLRRLYLKLDVNVDKIESLFVTGKITCDEKDYILHSE